MNRTMASFSNRPMFNEDEFESLYSAKADENKISIVDHIIRSSQQP